MQGSATDVFVSYKAEDRARLKPLVSALEAEGFTVWWDTHLGGGAHWRDDIEEHLEAAKCVIVAWTKRSVSHDSHFVRDEASRAQRRNVYLPIRLDLVEPPLGFGEIQAISLKGWRGDRSDARFRAVAEAIRSHLSEERVTQIRRPDTIGKVSRRRLVGAGAVAALAMLAMGGWALLKPSSGFAAANSIAVLPFANLSGDPAQGYFSDGVAEEIRNTLTRLPGLTVIGRGSSEAVRHDDPRTAAAKLGVATILTGSVRRSQKMMRITAELIDGKTGADKWSQDYDRPLGDVINIQTDIAENVVNALRIALGSAGRAALTVGGTSNWEAQDLLLQARSIDRYSRDGTERALELLSEALAIDPNYAQAYSAKAGTLVWLTAWFPRSSAERARSLAEANKLATRALELAPMLPSAHLTMADVHRASLRLSAARDQMQRALALAPRDAGALQEYALFLAQLGKLDQALQTGSKAAALDPVGRETQVGRIFLLYLARRYGDALAESHRFNGARSNVAPPLVASALILLGRNGEALEELKSVDPSSPLRLTLEGMIHARSGDRAAAIAARERLQQLYPGAANYELAKIDAQLGDKNQAFADLERAWEGKEQNLVFARVEPWFDPLRSDARYEALIERIGYPT